MPDQPSLPPLTPRGHRLRHLTITAVKLAIAVVGIWWVVHHTTWGDTRHDCGWQDHPDRDLLR